MKYKEITLSEPKIDGEEQLYVRSYLRTMDHGKAYNFLHPDSSSKNLRNKYSKRANVLFHINKGLTDRVESASIDEQDILNLLYSEAVYKGAGSNHNARINAITTLGKHMGLFKENKTEDSGVILNVVNYASETTPIEDKIVLSEEPVISSSSVTPNLRIIKFNGDN